LAGRMGISPLVIGLVVVGFGTSAPELVTSVQAAFAGAPGIAWGNIIGSNIANSLLILGVAVIVAPLVLTRAEGLRDPLVALVAAFGLAAIAYAGAGSALLGILGLVGITAYIFHCYRQSRTMGEDEAEALNPESGSGWGMVLRTLAGLLLLVGGGRILVMGAVELAELAGLSQTIIGLTVVAIGTSAPELATAIISARHRQMQLVFGNIVGSNIYNILAIGGVTMLIAPAPLPADLISRDIPIMLAAMAFILLVAWFNGRLARLAGFGLVLSYAAYLALLVVQQTG